jgi:hypothetical protein
MKNNYQTKNLDDKRNLIEERLAQLENGAVSTQHINVIANAIGNNAIAITGDANNAFVVAGNIAITREYYLPETVRVEIEKEVKSSRNRTIYFWLAVAFSWMIPSLFIAVIIKDYSEILVLTTNQMFHYLFGFSNSFYNLYLLAVMLVIGFSLIIGYNKGGYALGKWLWKPLIFAVALAIYQQLILYTVMFFRVLSIQNFYLLCVIIISACFFLGSITVLRKERNIRDDWLLYMVAPTMNFFHLHIALFWWIWRWK